MKNFDAAVFDLDGTLLDTLTSLWYASNDSMSREGLKNLPRENFRFYVGDGARKLVERYLKDTCAADGRVSGENFKDPHDPANFEYFYKSYLDSFYRYSDYEVSPYPGITELIQELKTAGIKTAVFTNKPDPAAQTLIKKHFGESFDVVLGQRDDLPRKPDPRGALLIAEMLKADPARVLYAGDTSVDMRTGKAAGMFTVGVLWGFRDAEELLSTGADMLAAAPGDILDFMR